MNGGPGANGANMVGCMLQTFMARFTTARDLGSIALIEIGLRNAIHGRSVSGRCILVAVRAAGGHVNVLSAHPMRYGAMAVSTRFGVLYQTRLHTSPADQRVAHEPTK